MISIYNERASLNNTEDRILELRGLSTDTKPTNVGNGSIFLEIDTGDVYSFNKVNNTWYKITSGGGGGSDLSDYFNNSFSDGATPGFNKPGWTDLVKKIPEPVIVSTDTMSFAFAWCNYIPQFTITNESSITAWNQCFLGCKDTRKLDLSFINFNANCQSFERMFWGSYFDEINMSSLGNLIRSTAISFQHMFRNSKARKINLSNLQVSGSEHLGSYMFSGCTLLEEIDMSSFDFTKISQYYNNNMFDNVPTNCLIYVKDQDQVDWFTTNYSNLTNVQIKS